jgi:hypothetical protein
MALPAGDYGAAISHQAAARHWIAHALQPMLASQLDSLHVGDEIVFIEKIELELTDYPWSLSEAAWRQKLASAIQVRHAVADSFSYLLKQWFFYLHHGYFETGAFVKSVTALEDYLVRKEHLWPAAPVQQYSVVVSPSFLQRLFFRHKDKTVMLFLEKWLQLPAEKVQPVYQALHKQSAIEPANAVAWLATMAQAVKEKNKAEVNVLLRQLAQDPLPTPDRKADKRILSRDTKTGENPETGDPAIALHCPCAGLVLLFPYISQFFQNCGLVKDAAFVSDHAQQLAVQALYFLASGMPSAPDEELLLPKLLCGLEPGIYLAPEHELPPFIQKEGRELLQEVIAHWKTLKSTSVKSFQETFLQREGRLLRSHNVYTLQVAESGVDVLLNSIPWGFRNYKLPWMPVALQTEWY